MRSQGVCLDCDKKIQWENLRCWDCFKLVGNKGMFKKGIIAKNKREDIREKREEIIQMYLDGVSTKEIAHQFKCSFQLICKILDENNFRRSVSESKSLGYKTGKIKPWNKGLSKEADKRIIGMSYEERFGIEKAKEMKQKLTIKMITNNPHDMKLTKKLEVFAQ